ncbi:amidohydrolase family protein [Desulfobulbus sp.]|uniref:amidohydrolase family protein n=1 Tax=Desulfobulbus sp. TaxID=895 RepID=UPI00286F794E|nr:amidohydrolase family protein [Desulfobulbus sp.]
MAPDLIRIHSAAWVVPVEGAPIENGAVAVKNGILLAVGETARLGRQYPGATVSEHRRMALTPALINAHIHLELSHLAALAASPLDTTFTGWINRLLQLRDRLGATGELAEQAARCVAENQYRSGTGVLADIGNTAIGRSLAAFFPGRLLPFVEYLGLAERGLAKNMQRLDGEDDATLCSGHAPYSTHPRLLRRLKERARALGQVFPIHTAEPAAEGEMIREGRGEMVEFIRQRGFWDGSFVPRGSGGTIHYFRDLGLLDSRTLCIHAIHVADEEVRIMAGEGVKVCLCPGSNQFLRTGTPPVRTYLDHGMLPALGTDSAASNPRLSLWREMRLLAMAHPAVQAAEIFRMATLGGAQALGMDRHLGTLAAGKKADLLAVPLPEDVESEEQLYRYLVENGEQAELDRILQ